MPDNGNKVFISHGRTPYQAQFQRDIARLIGQRNVLASPDTNLLVLPYRNETLSMGHPGAGKSTLANAVFGTTETDILNVTGTPCFVSASCVSGAQTIFISATAVDASTTTGVIPYRPTQQPLLGVGNQLPASPLSVYTAPWFAPFVGPPPSGRLAPFGLNAAVPAEPTTPGIEPMPLHLTAQESPVAARVIRLHLHAQLRADLLRLVGGILAACCRALILMHAALARRTDACSFVLVLVATSRCYGHRSEPDHHLLPEHRPMSAVRGGLVQAC